MRIFWKYHFKEYTFYTFSFFIIFSAIITLIQGIIKLQDFLNLNPPFKFIFQLFILVFFQLLSFIYSLSVFMGILFAIHRLKYEKEVLAFCSLGFSLKDFMKPLLIFSLISLIITFLAHFFLSPWSKRKVKEIQIELVKAQAEKSFPEKRPIALGKDYSLYVRNSEIRDKAHFFKNIFLLKREKEGKKGFFIAQEGSYSPQENTFTLIKGWGIFIDSQNNIEVLKFGDYKFKLDTKTFEEERLYFKRGEKSFSELKGEIKKLKPGTSNYFKYFNEYYQRFFFPLSVLFLTFQAFFLSIYLKTSYRFLLFFVGITVFLIFYILYNFFSSLGENGKIFPLWSFVIFYLLISILLVFQYVGLKRKRELYL
uniref:YjgP/YjgQ family permease n=1 Tax=Thermodesulfobacterium geofontis TaxID=1295609 RepID=A0A7V5XIB9_9BACT